VGDTYSVADVNLSGVVYEVTPMGRVPIEGDRVQSDYFHVFPTPDVVTDLNGFFSFRRVGLRVFMGALGGCGDHFDLCG
jgi:hypothetical protein